MHFERVGFIAGYLAIIALACVGLVIDRPFATQVAEGKAEGDSLVSVIVVGQTLPAAAQAIAESGGRVTRELALVGGVAGHLPADALPNLRNWPGVFYVTADLTVAAADQRHSRPLLERHQIFTRQRGLVALDVGSDRLHAAGIVGAGVTVAVVDSGVAAYPDLDLRFAGQLDFVDSTCDSAGIQHENYCYYSDLETSRDPYGHGTHVASVVANRQQHQSGYLGVAPGARILSIRVLDEMGNSPYERVIAGIETAIRQRSEWNIRVINLSLSSPVNAPYFADPLNQAVEEAWAAGIVVVTAAGNMGPGAETITVPGNDPYVITVGAITGNGTSGRWDDDYLPHWSSNGPTRDGFTKPDVLAPGLEVASYLMPQAGNSYYAEAVAQVSSTSMAAGIVSGIVAQMLQYDAGLDPDQVKYRLMVTAQPAVTREGELAHGPFQQGAGRVWAPDAVLREDIATDEQANTGMDIQADLAGRTFIQDVVEAHGPAVHYQGPVRRLLDRSGQTYLYVVGNPDGHQPVVVGAARRDDLSWISHAALSHERPIVRWQETYYPWQGYVWAGGAYRPQQTPRAAVLYNWLGENYRPAAPYPWSGSLFQSLGGLYNWDGGLFNWSDSQKWTEGLYEWPGTAGWRQGIVAPLLPVVVELKS